MLHRRGLMAATTAVAALGPSAFARAAHRHESETLALRPSRYEYARIGASVSVNGEGPFIFAVDSGSQRSMVADSLVTRLTLPATGQTQINGVTAPASLSTVGVRVLAFGLKTYGDLTLPVARRDLLSAEGLIGLDVLKDFKLTFHIDRGLAEISGLEMAVGDGGPTDWTGTHIPPRWHRAGRIEAGQLIARAVRVGGVRCWAFVDSGAQFSVGNGPLHTALAERRRPGVGPSTPLDLYDIPGLTQPGRRATVESIDLAGHVTGATPLLFADLHVFDVLKLTDTPALLIGGDLMGRFQRVILDYPQSRLAFETLRPEAER